MSPLNLKSRLRKWIRRWIIHNVNAARWHEGKSVREILHDLKRHMAYGAIALGISWTAYSYFQSYGKTVLPKGVYGLVNTAVGKVLLPGGTIVLAGVLISKGVTLYRLYRLSRRCQRENIDTGSDT